MPAINPSLNPRLVEFGQLIGQLSNIALSEPMEFAWARPWLSELNSGFFGQLGNAAILANFSRTTTNPAAQPTFQNAVYEALLKGPIDLIQLRAILGEHWGNDISRLGTTLSAMIRTKRIVKRTLNGRTLYELPAAAESAPIVDRSLSTRRRTKGAGKTGTTATAARGRPRRTATTAATAKQGTVTAGDAGSAGAAQERMAATG